MKMQGVQKRYRIITFVAAMAWMGTLRSQESGNLYIQSENKQAFYIQWNGNVYPSSTNGLLVIPRVSKGEQVILVGFPLNQYPEYTFHYTMGEKSAGLSLKLAVNNSWSLFDMVKFTQIQGILASVIQKPEEMKTGEALTTGGTGKILEPKPSDTLSQPQIAPEQLVLSATIQKIYNKVGSYGTDQVYVVNNDGKMDTVAIFIPVLSDGKAKTIAQIQHTTPKPAGHADFLFQEIPVLAFPKPSSKSSK